MSKGNALTIKKNGKEIRNEVDNLIYFDGEANHYIWTYNIMLETKYMHLF